MQNLADIVYVLSGGVGYSVVRSPADGWQKHLWQEDFKTGKLKTRKMKAEDRPFIVFGRSLDNRRQCHACA